MAGTNLPSDLIRGSGHDVIHVSRHELFRYGLSAQQLYAIILDYRIGQELVGGRLERLLGLVAVPSLDLDVEHLALAHAAHAFDAERFQRAFDRLALGIENAGF